MGAQPDCGAPGLRTGRETITYTLTHAWPSKLVTRTAKVGRRHPALGLADRVGRKRAVAVVALCVLGVSTGGLPAIAVGALVAGLISALALWEFDAPRGARQAAGCSEVIGEQPNHPVGSLILRIG